jgi:hypothetical protein
MIPYARLSPGPGFRPGNASLYYAQRLVTSPALRRAVARGIAAAIRVRQGSGVWGESDSACADALADLDRDGLSMLADDVAHGESVERIAAFFNRERVIGPDGKLVPLNGVPAGTVAAAYPLETVLGCQDVLDLINAPAVLRIAAGYLGCKPTLSSLGVRWSFPSPGPSNATQRFHRDHDDWRSLKLFVYLTDVDSDSGPHAYVRGSHKTSAKLRARPYAPAAIERRYGPDNMRPIVGPRGTTFMADTYGIHAGLPPLLRPRLILQAQYSVLPIFAFLYRPIAVRDRPAVDRYVNRLIVAG